MLLLYRYVSMRLTAAQTGNAGTAIKKRGRSRRMKPGASFATAKKERTQPAYETGCELCHRKGRYEQGCQDEREPSVRLDIEPGIGSHDNRERDQTDAASSYRKQQRGPVKEEGSGIQGKQKAQELPVGFPLHFMADIVWNEAGVAAHDYEKEQYESQPRGERKQKPG